MTETPDEINKVKYFLGRFAGKKRAIFIYVVLGILSFTAYFYKDVFLIKLNYQEQRISKKENDKEQLMHELTTITSDLVLNYGSWLDGAVGSIVTPRNSLLSVNEKESKLTEAKEKKERYQNSYHESLNKLVSLLQRIGYVYGDPEIDELVSNILNASPNSAQVDADIYGFSHEIIRRIKRGEIICSDKSFVQRATIKFVEKRLIDNGYVFLLEQLKDSMVHKLQQTH